MLFLLTLQRYNKFCIYARKKRRFCAFFLILSYQCRDHLATITDVSVPSFSRFSRLNGLFNHTSGGVVEVVADEEEELTVADDLLTNQAWLLHTINALVGDIDGRSTEASTLVGSTDDETFFTLPFGQFGSYGQHTVFLDEERGSFRRSAPLAVIATEFHLLHILLSRSRPFAKREADSEGSSLLFADDRLQFLRGIVRERIDEGDEVAFRRDQLFILQAGVELTEAKRLR